MFVANASHIVATGPRGRGRSLTLSAGLVAAAVSLAVGSAQSGERPYVARETSVYQGPLAVNVRIQGRTTPLFQASNRPDRWYLEARQGGKYEVVVRNTSGDRIGFVIAVDGLNAINGLRSHLGADEPMYVLDPYASATIKGWRKDLGNVSRFVFVDEERSYAARTDQANGDLGWIRVIAFHEVGRIAWQAPDWGSRMRSMYRDGGEAAPSAPRDARDQAAPPLTEGRAQRKSGTDINGAPNRVYEPAPTAERESSPGTGWGRNERDRVREVEFTPEQFACAQVILRYEYQRALVTLGILPWRGYDRDRLWERENGQLGFAQPPRW